MVQSASKIPFGALCNVLEGIQQKKTTADKRKLLDEFIDKWRSTTFSLNDAEDSFYPILRCIVPQLEKVAYGIKQHSLGRLYIDVMGLGRKSDAANILMNYKNPTSSTIVNKLVGDFAECAYDVLKDRCSVKSQLSVMDVIDRLNDIANGYSSNDKSLIRNTLEFLIKNLTGLENKWFIRMLVKEMKLGLGQDNILSAFHPDAPALFNVDTSLERICKTLRDKEKRLHEVEVSLFAPLKPMLGKQAKPTEVETLLQCQDFILERKFDGERMQLHKKNGEYKYYSRNGHEFTSTYGATQFDGNLTPKLHNHLKDVNNCILDGEMCGYDEELQVFGTKAMHFDIKSPNSTGRYTPCYVIFDILYLNDQVLTNKPLTERLKMLSSLVIEKEGLIMLSKTSTASSNKECVDALNQAIDRYEEGIMVKHPSSVYKPNSRTAGWYKIKPEYVDGLMDQLDVVIIGGYFGKGRRSKVLSHFLCAVLDNSNGRSHFKSMCRVGSGYTFKELLDFNVKLKDKWQRSQPSNVTVTKEKPDIWIDPIQSAILQIKATEIVESVLFSTNYTLRFPRVDKIRDDKGPMDCLTLADFHQMRQKRSGQLTSGIMDATVDAEPEKKRKKLAAPRSIAPTLPEQFKAANTSDIVQEGNIFEDKEFCVIQGNDDITKQQLEQQIVKFGGTVVQNASTNTYCIVTSKVNIKVRNYVKSGKYNIVKLDWLLSCLQEKVLLPWQPNDMIATTSVLQKEFDRRFDKFGDSFISNTNPKYLQKVFSLMTEKRGQAVRPLTKEDIRHIEEDNATYEDYGGSLLRSCTLYDCDGGKNSVTTLNMIQARFYGASVSDCLDSTVTHCLCSTRDGVKMAQEFNRTTDRKVRVISPEWVEESIHRENLLEERDFPPNPSF